MTRSMTLVIVDRGVNRHSVVPAKDRDQPMLSTSTEEHDLTKELKYEGTT